jgi:hypothetical protein
MPSSQGKRKYVNVILLQFLMIVPGVPIMTDVSFLDFTSFQTIRALTSPDPIPTISGSRMSRLLQA